MRISYENLDKCMHYIAYESKLAELLQLASGKNFDVESETKIAVFILESMIVEKLSYFQAYKQGKEYAQLRHAGSNVSMREEIRGRLEKKFPSGISEFLETFDGEFGDITLILKKLRKLFKNYKFRKSNAVNDYSVFFFTFKMFDLLCSETIDNVMIEDIADSLAAACFKELHNPYKKRQVTVSCQSLLRFVKQFPLEDYRYTYACCFIKYIQALNNSEILPDYIRYNIFERFSSHIIIMSAFLQAAINGKKIRAIFDSQFADRLKVNKYISNKIQKFKKERILAPYADTLKELQKNISGLVKSIRDTDLVSKKKIYAYCTGIHTGIIAISNLINEGYEEEFHDVLNQYLQLGVTINGEEISVFSVVLKFLGEEDVETFKSKLIKYNKSNIYIELLFTYLMSDQSDIEHHKIKRMYGEVMSDIYDYVSDNIFVESVKEYEQIIKYVDLDEFQFPILTINESDSSFQSAIGYILPCLD